jgi:hypothetical protein
MPRQRRKNKQPTGPEEEEGRETIRNLIRDLIVTMPDDSIVRVENSLLFQIMRVALIKRPSRVQARNDIPKTQLRHYFFRGFECLQRRDPTRYDHVFYTIKHKHLTNSLREKTTAWEFWSKHVEHLVDQEEDMKELIPAYMGAIFDQAEFEHVVAPDEITCLVWAADKIFDTAIEALDQHNIQDKTTQNVYWQALAAVHWVKQLQNDFSARNAI